MSISIYRYNLNPEIMDNIIDFAKIHQHDDRKTYKEYWQEWCKDNKEEIDNEIERLENLGYNGSVIDKMYKAGRYYFRKKFIIKNNTDDNINKSFDKDKEEKEKRRYISIDSMIIETMDIHIKDNYEEDNYKPAVGFKDYCEINKELLHRETQRLLELDMTETEISNKIKKTYKNRYYIITRANNK